MSSLSDHFRSLRRRFKAALPFVRRREYRVLQRRYAELIEAVDGQATLAAAAKSYVVKPFAQELTGDVCLFVSYAARPTLKRHVQRHIEGLLDAGVCVLLIVNTEHSADRMAIDAGMLDRLSGAWVRQNLGFDFGAWAHALQALGDTRRWTRLFLVNDSIVGPLDDSAFDRMLARVRASDADIIGLTEALAPRRHLQSYFLVLQARALRSVAMQRFFARMQNWPSKSQVIDLYESRLTAIAQADGLRCAALFPNLSNDPLSSDDTSLRWAQLVHAGFPYLKSRVISKHAHDKRLRDWLHASGMDDQAKP
ncbi:MAG: rhamnan synthesis F family protein [Betaproteobacteria bacterium]